MPSQVPAVFSKTLPEQIAALQTVCSGKMAQAPKPSHRPVVPQVLRSSAGQALCGCPASTNLHRPTEPV